MACKHKVGRISLKMALSGIQDELICSKCGKRIRLTRRSEWGQHILCFASAMISVGVGQLCSLRIPSDAPLLVFDLVFIPTALILVWCTLALYMRFFARFEEIPEAREGRSSGPDAEADMPPCKHRLGRFSLQVLGAKRDTRFVCCKCGREIQFTPFSAMVKNILLLVVVMIVSCFGCFYLAREQRLDERPVLEYMLISGIAYILTWCVLALYVRFLARFKDAPKERKIINISLRDDA